MASTRRACIRKKTQSYMEEAGQEIGFFRNMEEIKALSAIGRLFDKWRKNITPKNDNK